MVTIDTEALARDGFVVLQGLVSNDDIAEFERQVARFGQEQATKLGLSPVAREPFIDLFRRGGAYTKRLYSLLEDLIILHRMSVTIGGLLERSGFLSWADIRVPLVWPDIRADVPHDLARSLPVHQDFASTQCRRAWRVWVPLRPSSAAAGSLALYPGTHTRGPLPHNTDDPLSPFVKPEHYAGVEPVVFDLDAGDGVLMNPFVVHASVPNRSERTKFTLMVQVQDYASLIDPDDADDELAGFGTITRLRNAARAAT